MRWLVSGRRIFIPSLLSSLLIFGVFIVNLNALDTVYLELPALGAALSLCIIHFPRHRLDV